MFHRFRLSDGSGSQFGGLTVGYARQLPSGIVVGGETAASFTAKPLIDGGVFNDTPESFGSVRGRIGYVSALGLLYATGGVVWTHDQLVWESPTPTGGPADAGKTAFANRLGWTIGGGIDVPMASGWSARAQYLYSRLGTATVGFADGSRVASELSLHQLQVGLNYTLGSGADDHERLAIAPLDLGGWSAHGQTTFVSQYAPPFRAPYRGANSLDSNSGRETWDVTLYVGRRLWRGGELWLDPEIDQGYGLSNTLGVEGFPSGEAYKVGYTSPYLRVPRVFIRQTVNFGGAARRAESGLNQFADVATADRLVVTIGRFAVSDVFDTLTYAHDPRGDFMNWSLVDAGTFDYAADAWGFTYGAAIEWYQGPWTARAGVFDLSVVPNSVELDAHFGQYQLLDELEHRHTWRGRPGKVAVVGYLTRGRMGRYDDALAAAQTTGAAANTADVRRYDSRPGVNVNAEQQIVTDVGLFGRVGLASGQVEGFEFTDIDRTASTGISIGGRRWGRARDVFGLATAINGITRIHQAYLNAGGLGILAGDGKLPHPGPEAIIETYYRVPLRSWWVTANYQFIVNPAFNRDRGPVSVVGVRVHAQF